MVPPGEGALRLLQESDQPISPPDDAVVADDAAEVVCRVLVHG
jgi:hypothetical protein